MTLKYVKHVLFFNMFHSFWDDIRFDSYLKTVLASSYHQSFQSSIFFHKTCWVFSNGIKTFPPPGNALKLSASRTARAPCCGSWGSMGSSSRTGAASLSCVPSQLVVADQLFDPSCFSRFEAYIALKKRSCNILHKKWMFESESE